MFDKDKLIEQLVEKYPIYDLVSFDETNIVEKISKNPYLVMQYQDLALKAKIKYEEIEELKDKLTGELYHKYRFEQDEELSTKEIEKYYLPKDPKILKVNELLRKQKIVLEFFNCCVKGLDRAYWSMKEYGNNLRN